ncbi:MAG: hypothetical protein J5J00_16090, partial [Deltaproteobacteria bacterium]|nr:hypothetical protein [Deltaproteobacteria bacterium]
LDACAVRPYSGQVARSGQDLRLASLDACAVRPYSGQVARSGQDLRLASLDACAVRPYSGQVARSGLYGAPLIALPISDESRAAVKVKWSAGLWPALRLSEMFVRVAQDVVL